MYQYYLINQTDFLLTGMHVNAKRLAVSVVVSVKVIERPGSDIGNRSGKINVHQLRNTGVVKYSIHWDFPNA